MSHDELLDYVFQNIQKHSDEAKQKNSRLFILIDSNRNGLDFINVIEHIFLSSLGRITWHEYAALYVKFHHMNESDIRDFDDVDFIKESFDKECMLS